ncbi:hypothetical protein GGR56DRAFT_675219 [Xylariaceae sp. FL0804]|nr:hypothetical protein GGR56DRAFT_675219 [Xylariaceae sp. FL0804]
MDEYVELVGQWYPKITGRPVVPEDRFLLAKAPRPLLRRAWLNQRNDNNSGFDPAQPFETSEGSTSELGEADTAPAGRIPVPRFAGYENAIAHAGSGIAFIACPFELTKLSAQVSVLMANQKNADPKKQAIAMSYHNKGTDYTVDNRELASMIAAPRCSIMVVVAPGTRDPASHNSKFHQDKESAYMRGQDRTHGPYPCPMKGCEKECPNKSSLDKHRRDYHTSFGNLSMFLGESLELKAKKQAAEEDESEKALEDGKKSLEEVEVARSTMTIDSNAPDSYEAMADAEEPKKAADGDHPFCFGEPSMHIHYRAPSGFGGDGELDLAPDNAVAQLLEALRAATSCADIFVYCDYPPEEVKLYDGSDSPGECESDSFNGFDETMPLAEVDLLAQLLDALRGPTGHANILLRPSAGRKKQHQHHQPAEGRHILYRAPPYRPSAATATTHLTSPPDTTVAQRLEALPGATRHANM